MSNPGNAPATNSGNGIAVGSLVLGIVGVVFAFLFSIVGLIAGIIGLVLGFIARRRAVGSRGMVLAGIVLSVIAIIVAIIFMIIGAVVATQMINN
ncbi:hypothetical protein K0028_01860 [Curtobacterium flaccumfaciens pv. flaccumfaciens]|jgi:hypothetical protein|uniref:hypothetical protein n=1 Tax=Curtobacterium flaccumfaciens TaxID=2035 RepID=UPI00217E4F68|nr:hypothetical protein [Curtobacterium flaccumfaciens]MCS6553712.1 hypothetical protein [Curtobacterium flaccumfaciens]QYI97715.1 hypothetical protein K0028_01860 [Curtobacterium flaccumfaciens pv. flaccumfaciens]